MIESEIPDSYHYEINRQCLCGIFHTVFAKPELHGEYEEHVYLKCNKCGDYMEFTIGAN